MIINGLDNYNELEIKRIILDYINNLLEDIDDNEFNYVCIELIGSRIKGNNRIDSDLDAIVYYSGKMKEDSAFNLFNDESYRLHIDDIVVDINPKKIELLFNKKK